MDDPLILTKVDWTYNIQKLLVNLNKLKELGLKFNTENTFFGKP